MEAEKAEGASSKRGTMVIATVKEMCMTLEKKHCWRSFGLQQLGGYRSWRHGFL